MFGQNPTNSSNPDEEAGAVHGNAPEARARTPDEQENDRARAPSVAVASAAQEERGRPAEGGDQ